MPNKSGGGGFMSFVNWMRPTLDKEEGRRLTVEEAVVRCNDLWPNLSSEDRASWKKRGCAAAGSTFRGRAPQKTDKHESGIKKNEEKRIRDAARKEIAHAYTEMARLYPINCESDEAYEQKGKRDVRDAGKALKEELAGEIRESNMEEFAAMKLVVLAAVPWLSHDDSQIYRLAEIAAVCFSVSEGIIAEKSWLLDFREEPVIAEVEEQLERFPDLPLPVGQRSVVSMKTFHDELLQFSRKANNSQFAWLHLPTRSQYNMLQGALQHIRRQIKGDTVDISDYHANQTRDPEEYPSRTQMHRQRLRHMLAPLYWMKREGKLRREVKKTKEVHNGPITYAVVERPAEFPNSPTFEQVMSLFDVDAFLLAADRSGDELLLNDGAIMCAYHRHIGEQRVRVRPTDCAAATARLIAAFYFEQLGKDYEEQMEEVMDTRPDSYDPWAHKRRGYNNVDVSEDEEEEQDDKDSRNICAPRDDTTSMGVGGCVEDGDSVELAPIHSDCDDDLDDTDNQSGLDEATGGGLPNAEDMEELGPEFDEDQLEEESGLLKAVQWEKLVRLPLDQQLLLDKQQRLNRHYEMHWDGPYDEKCSRFICQLGAYTDKLQLCEALNVECLKKVETLAAEQETDRNEQMAALQAEEQRCKMQTKYAQRDDRARRRRKNDRRRGVNMDGHSDLDYSDEDYDGDSPQPTNGTALPVESYGDEGFWAEMEEKKRRLKKQQELQEEAPAVVKQEDEEEVTVRTQPSTRRWWEDDDNSVRAPVTTKPIQALPTPQAKVPLMGRSLLSKTGDIKTASMSANGLKESGAKPKGRGRGILSQSGNAQSPSSVRLGGGAGDVMAVQHSSPMGRGVGRATGWGHRVPARQQPPQVDYSASQSSLLKLIDAARVAVVNSLLNDAKLSDLVHERCPKVFDAFLTSVAED